MSQSTEDAGQADVSKPVPTDTNTARVIDENTDLSTLTDQEIMRLMEGMDNQPVDNNKPLISAPVPLSVIREEYRLGSDRVLKKLDWLGEHGWDQVWRAKGDGDCFYRSFTIAYLLRILHSEDQALEANLAYDALQRSIPVMQQCGFDQDLIEDFLAPLLELIRSFAPEEPDATTKPSEYTLIQSLQDAERSNCIVVVLRLMTSSHIRSNPTQYTPFLLSPTTFLPLSPDDFCKSEVEPCGREADNVQIMALAEALGVGIRIAYLDRSEVVSGDVINWVEFDKCKEEERPLTLLYRPGHFDVVTKDVLPVDVPDT